jgi:hypothetical protein
LFPHPFFVETKGKSIMQRKLIGSTLALVAAATLLVAGSGTASAVPIQFWDGFGANGHWYEIRGASQVDGPGTADLPNLTWANANTAAPGNAQIPGYRASLVTITSEAEWDFLMNSGTGTNHGVIGAAIAASATDRAWIGAHDNDANDVYEWVPVTMGTSTPVQEPFVYTHWASGEPTGGLNPVVFMNLAGDWLDAGDGNQHYIYEWSPLPEPGSIVLCSLGALAMAGYGWRRRRNRAQAAA